MCRLFRKNSIEVTVYIYQSEFDAILAEVREFPRIETGGDLFGSFTHGNMPVIWWATGPGPNAQRHNFEFSQDVEFTTYWQKFLMDNFGIQYIGTWHSHHQLGLKHPSNGDVQAVHNYARRHRRQKTLEIIANSDGKKTVLRPYFYPNAPVESWVEANFKLLHGESPIRQRLGLHKSNLQNVVRHTNPQIDSSELIGVKNTESEIDEINYSVEPPLPLSLQTELGNLEIDGIRVERKKDDFFVIEIQLNSDQLLAIVVQTLEYLKVIQVNFIDQYKEDNRNITPTLVEKGIISNKAQRNGEILRKILDFIQQSD